MYINYRACTQERSSSVINSLCNQCAVPFWAKEVKANLYLKRLVIIHERLVQAAQVFLEEQETDHEGFETDEEEIKFNQS